MFKKLQIPDFLRSIKQAHQKALFDQLNPVQGEDWKNRVPVTRKSNPTFLIIAIIFILIFLDSIFGLEYEYSDNFNIRNIPTSKYIFLHQIPIKIMWTQTDPLMLSNTFTTFMVYIILYRYSFLPERYRIYPLNYRKNVIVDSKGLFSLVVVESLDDKTHSR